MKFWEPVINQLIASTIVQNFLSGNNGNSNMIEKKLYDATLKGDGETLEALMREDELVLAQFSVTSCFNKTPLHLAAMLEEDSSVCLVQDEDGRTPLHLAISNGQYECILLVPSSLILTSELPI
ncbi:hypothetical protein AgCh_026109 [Apium graveolens]